VARGIRRLAVVRERRRARARAGTHTCGADADICSCTAPAPESRGALIAERNETSVLFTLHNLAKLAHPTQAVTAASHARAAGPVTEGSGLIDIRALARTMVPNQPKPVTARSGSLDDIPDFAPVGFGEPAVLVPLARSGPDRKLVLALGASVGMLAIVAIILIIVMLRRDGTPTAEAATPPAPTPAMATTPPAATTATPPPSATPPQTQTHETSLQRRHRHRPSSKPSSNKPSSSKPSSSKPSSSKPSSSKPSSSKPSSTPIASTNPLAKPPAESDNKCDKITCLVNGNADPCCAVFRDGASSSSETGKPARTCPKPRQSCDRGRPRQGERERLLVGRKSRGPCPDQGQHLGCRERRDRVEHAEGRVARKLRERGRAAHVVHQGQRSSSFSYVWRF